ncbi:unnamed protein product, partial [Soboliphyme baturini]|uniref:Lipase domain-containing protein n=1 Tax=Soboliphyme baturini TaxID=241478 RepID=A0A183J0Q3_9BILA
GHKVAYIEWEEGSQFPFYDIAIENVPIVGKGIARFVKHAPEISPANLTCIGFSLGAHVCGFVGKALRNLYRIIGLDPAGPEFDEIPHAKRLREGDASFVECIHTDATFGTTEAVCDQDFFANEGHDQKLCENDLSSEEYLSNMIDQMTCSHSLAHEIFIQSIRDYEENGTGCRFTSVPCSSEKLLHKGHCFKCRKNTATLPAAGFEARQTNTHWQGRFYFATTFIKENLCGSLYSIKLKADKSVKGQILLNVQREDGHSYEIEFQE